MKLTQWQYDQILEGLDCLIEAKVQEGRGTKNLEKLHQKIRQHGEQTGKSRD